MTKNSLKMGFFHPFELKSVAFQAKIGYNLRKGNKNNNP